MVTPLAFYLLAGGTALLCVAVMAEAYVMYEVLKMIRHLLEREIERLEELQGKTK